MRKWLTPAVLSVWAAVVPHDMSAQQPLSEAAQLVRQADYVWLNRNLGGPESPDTRLRDYNRAYDLALNKSEAPILTILAERYLRLGYDNAAVQCYASAVGAAVKWMQSDPYRGQNYRYGFDALNHLINNYNYIITQVPRLINPDPAMVALRGWAQYASDVARTASQPAAVQTPQSPPRPGGTGALPPCDTSGPNSCDIILTPRNPR
jgi:hypothetical protein